MFTHLRTYSANSITKSILRVDQIVELAKENGQDAVAITDYERMIGTLDHYETARKAGLKPIIGVDVAITSDVTSPNTDPHRILLLAKDTHGYKELMALVTRANVEQVSTPIIKQSWLKETKGLICLSGQFHNSEIAEYVKDIQSETDKAVRQSYYAELTKALNFYKETFGDDFYLEIERIGEQGEDDVILAYVELSQKFNIPLVATNPIEFATRADYVRNEARHCAIPKSINETGQDEFLYDVNRDEYCSPEQYFKSTAEMEEIFKGLEVALENTHIVAQKCNVDIQLDFPRLPSFPIPEDEKDLSYRTTIGLEGFEKKMHEKYPLESDFHANYEKELSEFNQEAAYFRKLSIQGFESRMNKLYPDPVVRAEKYPIYRERLNYEMDIIEKMGFTGYFLIVQDFINWSLQNGVAVGPGRGSGAGSLVAYSLNITNLDPLEFDLLFERFLNPDRVSMPDFDIDFSTENRYKVLEYVRNKYGQEHVSQINAPGIFQHKSSIDTSQRILSAPKGIATSMKKALLPENDKSSLEEVYESNPEFKAIVDESDHAKEIYDIARGLRDLPQRLGIHAAGVVIYDGKSSDYSASYVDIKNNTPKVSMFDKNDIERAGGVKFDFLGLQSLDIRDFALQTIKSNLGVDLHSDDIPLHDDKALGLLRNGNTSGIFQLEGKGMTKWMKELQPTSLEDLISMIALYRPGPIQSGMLEHFIARKHGKEQIFYPLEECNVPELKPVLESTYGTILYQEQVMKVAQVVAGYSLGQADLLRRAMGKKKPEEMAKQRSIFVDGAVKKGFDEKTASDLFDIVERFAGYGFNKSHSAAYGVVGMQLAYLKAYYPEHLLCSALNERRKKGGNANPEEKGANKDNEEIVNQLIANIAQNQITILPIDINKSFMRSMPDSHSKSIQLGFHMVFGLPSELIQNIVVEREKNGEYTGLKNFIERNLENGLTASPLKMLAKAGALDSFNSNSAELELHIDTIMKERKKLLTQRLNKGVDSILPVGIPVEKEKVAKKKKAKDTISIDDIELVSVPDKSLLEKAKDEISVLKMNLKHDIMSGYENYFHGLKALMPLSDIEKLTPDQKGIPVTTCGVITEIRNAKNGKMITVVGVKPKEGEFADDNYTIDMDSEVFTGNIDDEPEFIDEDPMKARTRRIYLSNKILEASKGKIAEGKFVVLQGSVTPPARSKGYTDNSFFPNNIYSKDELEQFLVTEVNLLVNHSHCENILPILKEFPGKVPVNVYVPSKNLDSLYKVALRDEFYIDGSRECFERLRDALGDRAVKMEFRDKFVTVNNNRDETNTFVRPPRR